MTGTLLESVYPMTTDDLIGRECEWELQKATA